MPALFLYFAVALLQTAVRKNFNYFFDFPISTILVIEQTPPFMPLALRIKPTPILLFFSFFLLHTSAFSQESYQDGYIVIAKGDTIRGLIDFRDWLVNPVSVNFQRARTGERASYGPQDLAGFFVNGEVYRSYRVRVYPYSRNPVTVLSPEWHGDPYDSLVFLRLITRGRLNLYSYRNRADVTYFFLQSSSATPEQLRVSNRIIEKNGENSMETDELYRFQLADWLADCPKTAERPVNVAYTESALRKLIFTYDNCGKDTVEQEPTRIGDKGISVTPMIGYFHSALHVSQQNLTNWPAYSGVTGGLGIQALLPRTRGQFGFLADILFSHFYSQSGTYQVNDFTTENGVFDFNKLSLDLQFRYFYPAGRVRPFLGVGLSNTLLFSNKSTHYQHDVISGQNSPLPIFGLDGGIRTYQIGFLGEAGIAAGRWTLEARYEATSGLSNGGEATFGNFYIVTGFRL